MARDVVLVTGGNSGIGFECARQLARAGWHVLIASRNRQASAEAVDRIARDSGADAASELGLDLGSIAAVRQFARGRPLPPDFPMPDYPSNHAVVKHLCARLSATVR